jgi:hypothetical protein
MHHVDAERLRFNFVRDTTGNGLTIPLKTAMSGSGEVAEWSKALPC